MNVEHLEPSNSSNGNLAYPLQEPKAPSPRAVFEELFQLLEDYAPTWYTEEHHQRAEAALRRTDW